jgi:hypothetical protein
MTSKKDIITTIGFVGLVSVSSFPGISSNQQDDLQEKYTPVHFAIQAPIPGTATTGVSMISGETTRYAVFPRSGEVWPIPPRLDAKGRPDDSIFKALNVSYSDITLD